MAIRAGAGNGMDLNGRQLKGWESRRPGPLWEVCAKRDAGQDLAHLVPVTTVDSRLSPADRLGKERAALRLRREDRLAALKRGRGLCFWRRWKEPRTIVRWGLGLTGLRQRAYEEFLDVRIVENEVSLRRLPAAFEGFRLAQISDLHCDIDPALVARVIERLRGLRFDRCVLTGDYHDVIGRPWDTSLELMRTLVPHCGPEPVGILGNHDFLAKVVPLEEMGLRILLNENLPIERGDARIWLCGIDDPHTFGTHDLAQAMAGIPEDELRILLAHSPEVWREAARMGFDLMLCGHTHGGQICLPGGFPIVRRARVPRRMIAGPWSVGSLRGYTSRGTGGCSVPARLNCPPEITVHVLRRG